MKVTYESDVDSEDERAWWPVKGGDGLLWALPKPSAFGSGVKVTVHPYDDRDRCPECDQGFIIYDGIEAGYTLAHCSSSFCGWSS
jgi:hypothetical protein